MTAAAEGFSNFDMGRVVGRTFGVIGRNLVPFALLAVLLSGVPQAIVGYIIAAKALGVGSGSVLLVTIMASVIGFVAASVLQASVIHGTIADLNDRKAAFGDCLSTGLRFLLPVIGVSVLSALAYVVGFVLLIIPGLWLVVTWCVNVPVVVVERVPVMSVFSRSSELTRNHRWAILGLVVVYAVLAGVLQRVGIAVTGGQSLAILGIGAFNAPQYVVLTLLSVVESLVGAVGVASIYYELRSIKEGVGPATLAAVFD